MKRIYLVSHCSAAGQHKDSPLTDVGMRQAQLLSTFFSDQNFSIDKIISSPNLHAIESIKPFSEKLGIPIDINDQLKERILSEEPLEDWLEAIEHSFKDPNFTLTGGESANDAIRRGNNVLEEIYGNNAITCAIIITHRNLLALLIQQYDNQFGYDKWKELKSSDVYLLNYNDSVQSIDYLPKQLNI